VSFTFGIVKKSEETWSSGIARYAVMRAASAATSSPSRTYTM
jgi:hypothetical protein